MTNKTPNAYDHILTENGTFSVLLSTKQSPFYNSSAAESPLSHNNHNGKHIYRRASTATYDSWLQNAISLKSQVLSDDERTNQQLPQALPDIKIYGLDTPQGTYIHWQLRDLVTPSSVNCQNVLYSSDNTIKSLNLVTRKLTSVFKTEYGPRCFKEANGVLVSGGLASHGSLHSGKGLFSVHNQHSEILETIPIGSLINNSVSVNPLAGSPNQFISHVCNNDQWLYGVDISNREIKVTCSKRFKSALNHSSLSPDQKMVVACGDSSDILLLDQEAFGSGTGNSTKGQKIITTRQDCGFSTSFNRSGTLFTCCFQDGTNLIYDVRQTDIPLQEVLSSRKRAQYGEGAFRVAKFSPLHDDLLIISEHVSRVHLVDTRNFQNHQVVIMPMANKVGIPESASGHGYEPILYDYDYVMANATPSAYAFSLMGNGTFTVSNSSGSSPIPSSTEPSPFYSSGMTATPGATGYPSVHNNRNGGRIYRRASTATYDPWIQNAINLEGQVLSDDERTSQQTPLALPDTIARDAYEYSDTEICGLDWLDTPQGTYMLIGTHQGITKWKVNSWSRRCFPSYTMV
ncbi:hypothetical protein BABINDRAFT_8962 [Babjeviella inositovora NRRL Y-12698]|uniref:DUF2415 domain-containing protein n=1 Tax=Babjeviella inositovora NRRL Y-12698 TaxID=984486 RepID=A0A1E3QLZ3_9ASCO|nr:uncharacterized protein BABINDRAFT_8962 [Babjeviella inositovora NRRL Y-12698]ODQ78719.1 hypothetical protein BABINDRAFT_8962 [Babjeviella inositovora NRRL Y-12698]